MTNMRTENWCGYKIRFVEIKGEWYAILKDICDALRLRTDGVSQRLHPDMLERVEVESYRESLRPSKYSKKFQDHNSNGVVKSKVKVHMLAVNEDGIYLALYASRKLEARKFQMWSAKVMRKLRERVGLQQYEVLKMTNPEIQDEIDWILDTLYWDPKKKCVMQSVTVQGGDVDQVVFCK